MKCKFKKSAQSANWVALESTIPGAKDVVEEICIMLNLLNISTTLHVTRSNKLQNYKLIGNQRPYNKYLSIKVTAQLCIVYLSNHENKFEEYLIHSKEELKKVLQDWIVRKWG